MTDATVATGRYRSYTYTAYITTITILFLSSNNNFNEQMLDDMDNTFSVHSIGIVENPLYMDQEDYDHENPMYTQVEEEKEGMYAQVEEEKEEVYAQVKKEKEEMYAQVEEEMEVGVLALLSTLPKFNKTSLYPPLNLNFVILLYK